MKWIDLPPVWLALAIAATAASGQSGGFGNLARIPGIALIAAGLCLMVLAVVEMARHRTTVIPHREADHLVTTGIFGFSRNPIYLGDVLVLSGCVLLFGTPIALVIVPVFAWILRTRFIGPEEARLRASFGPEFDRYAGRVRRWL